MRIVSNTCGPLLGQAREFHSADIIIISSNGAQLANLAFIHPCTVIVELFPHIHIISETFRPLHWQQMEFRLMRIHLMRAR